jgi:regulatory protein
MYSYRMLRFAKSAQPTLFSVFYLLMPEIYNTAIRILSRRDHSCAELQEKLLARSFPREEIDILIIKLVEKNFLDDLRFAQNYFRMRTNKGYGIIRIAAELRERGLAKEIISSVQNENFSGDIESVCFKKFGTKDFKDMNTRAKAIRFLQYRGFTLSQINRLFKGDIL